MSEQDPSAVNPSTRPPPRLRSPDRQQVIPAMPLENLLDSDHQARLVWDFCQGLDLAPLYDSIRSRLGGPGRAALDPRLGVALWLYATLEGIGSARALDYLCTHHNAFRWLCGGVCVNYHTLADFRVDHVTMLDDLLTHSVAVLRAAGPRRSQPRGPRRHAGPRQRRGGFLPSPPHPPGVPARGPRASRPAEGGDGRRPRRSVAPPRRRPRAGRPRTRTTAGAGAGAAAGVGGEEEGGREGQGAGCPRRTRRRP